MHRERAVTRAHFDVTYAHYRDDPVLAARVQVNRGPLLARLGRVDAGVEALAEAEAILREHALFDRLPPLLINRSELEARRGQYHAMLAYAREAEQAALRCASESLVVIAWINQAFAAMFLGDLALTAIAILNWL